MHQRQRQRRRARLRREDTAISAMTMSVMAAISVMTRRDAISARTASVAKALSEHGYVTWQADTITAVSSPKAATPSWMGGEDTDQ
jgi:hypothetical protein